MERSEQINEIVTALSKAQGEFGPIGKSGTGKITEKASYTYAELNDVLATVLPVLSKNGLALSQFNQTIDSAVLELTTFLAHTSGQYFQNVAHFPLVKVGNNAMQGVGGTSTYARRYEIMAILGLSPVDTDLADAEDLPERKAVRPKNDEGRTIGSPDDTQTTGSGNQSIFASILSIVNQKEVPEDKKPGIMAAVSKAKASKNEKLLNHYFQQLKEKQYDSVIAEEAPQESVPKNEEMF